MPRCGEGCKAGLDVERWQRAPKCATLAAMVEPLKGLLIRVPFIDWILAGKKTWEIRGSATKIRGPIALIQSASGMIVGTCKVVDVVGPLTSRELKANARRLNRTPRELAGPLYYGAHTFAWVLEGAKRLARPIPYDHPSGAVIWVNLTPSVARKIRG